MPRAYQLPKVFIRGAIATQTMSNMPADDVQKAEDIIKLVLSDPAMAGDKHEFVKQLGATIGGEYRSDPDTAYQEFIIAVWRATIHLMYHKGYTYNCELCGETAYTTSANKVKAFDRQYTICPNCRRTIMVVDGQKTTCEAAEADNNITIKYGDATKIIPSTTAKNSLISPIKPIAGQQKVENPEDVIDDDIQRRKWYKVWVWNYLRQILRDNPIETSKTVVEISGPADEVLADVIISDLREKRVTHYFDRTKERIENELEIDFDTLATEIEFTHRLWPLRKQYNALNVDLRLGDNPYSLKIKPTGAIPIYTDTITNNEPVIVLSRESSNNDGSDDNNWSDVVDAGIESSDSDVDIYDSHETMNVVRDNLYDDNAKVIFDIYSQTGENWLKYSEKWGDKAHKAHIAKHLGISVKSVKQYETEIKLKCMMYGMC